MADSDTFKNPLAEPWAKLVHLVQQRGGYSHIIAASNSFGKNVMPRAAALLDVSPVTDVTGISDSHTFIRCVNFIFVRHSFFHVLYLFCFNKKIIIMYCTIRHWSLLHGHDWTWNCYLY